MAGVIAFFTTYLTRILAISTGFLLFLSMMLGLAVQHYYGAAHDCKTAVKTVNAAATKQKVIIETREVKSNAKIGNDTTNRINNALGRLQDSRRKPYLSPTPTRPGTLDATVGTPELLPVGSLAVNELVYYNDQKICVTNTIVAEGWQAKERADSAIREEEIGVVRNTNP